MTEIKKRSFMEKLENTKEEKYPKLLKTLSTPISQPKMSFGPQTKFKQLDIGKKVKKLIHYDCNEGDDMNMDVPEEDEIFIKENLLEKKREEVVTE
jgi:hypothetical protein